MHRNITKDPLCVCAHVFVRKAAQGDKMLTSIRDAVFGKPPPTLREIKRENKKMARRANRDIDRQMCDVERREAELMKSMKAACKKGDHKASKALSLDVVRVRRTKAKVAGSRSAQMSLECAISNNINGAAIAESMQNGIVSMQTMSRGMNPMQLHQMGSKFSKEMDKMQVVDEVMEDVMSAQMGDEDENEEEQAKEILDEMLHGIAIQANIPTVASGGGGGEMGAYQRELGILSSPPRPEIVAQYGDGDGDGDGDGGGGGKQENFDSKLDLEERLRRLMQ